MTIKSIAAGLLATTMLAGAAQAATLQVAIDSAPAGLDPHLITAFNSVVIVQGNIYEGLTAIDIDLAVVPGLAESWEVSDDGLTYTFSLREGVTFHDGSAMTAQDVAASIARVQAEATGSPLASRVSPITAVNVVDDLTVELVLNAPFAPILTSLSGIAIVPAEFESDVDALQQTPVGTGPFAFADWQPNSYIELTRFEDYHQQGKPQLDAVRFHFVPESATRQVGITSGDYHLLPAIDPATALQLQGIPNVTVQETRDLSYTLVGFNAAREPFGDPVVRTAFNMMLDRNEIIEGALFGAGVPAGPLSPALVNWALDTGEYACYETDRDAAMAMLEEAGVELPVRLTMNVLPRQDTRDIAQVVQQQVSGAFEIELLNQEIGQFVQDWQNSNFDLFVSANGGSPDPDEYFYRTFRGGGSTNVFRYDDAEIDEWLDAGRSETEFEARKAIYDQVQRKLACEGPIAHIAYGNLFTAVANSVEGFEIYANGRLTSLVDVTVQ
ncbi:ABC transporter substrate-binding protein [Pelagibacterium lentulum]|uniref:ABC transporter substrate-binding protein n=1 Tax=Pelagibacterium lentulum TaxID=2029865 RepID=A0A916R664_9HYPH|nr:ABC transporter substrate-binding protein [Pelagibacterium lentulum]GGA36561.1 ABC transporter substrate-binding protein [Pelagibacterium lentulum]